MSNSSLVSYKKISPNKTSPRNRSIDIITPHCYVGQVTVEDMGAWLCNPSAQASANYGIGKDGRVGLFVEEKDRSWCSSSSANDNRAITIECASDTKDPYAINDKVYKSLVNLMADICRRNGKNRIIWFGDKNKTLNYTPKSNEMLITVHRWYANKACPGDYIYSRLGQIAKEVNVMLGSNDTPTAVSQPLYRVRKSWADSSSQIFAGTLEGAKNACTSGYAVYDENGKEVYRAPVSSIREQNQKILDSLPDYKGLPDNQQDYINKVAEICVKLYPYTKILPSVVIAQSFLENGGGTAADAIELTKRNNLIGQKASLLNNTWSEYTVWDGTKFSKRTPENYGNGIVYITDWFRVFPSYKYSILDYEMFLSWAKNDSGYKYRDVIGMIDPQKMITLISQRGYATGTTYISSVMRIIKQYNLTKYDVMAGVSTSDDYTTAPTTSISYYRVAKSYKDGTYVGQIGAYSSKDNALASAKENNLNCYDPDGKVIYTASIGKVTEVAYRVQCGEFEVKKNCKAMVKQMKKRGFDAKTVKLARKRYIAQAGVFSIKSNAERLRKQIEEAGLPCIIVEQEV